jgi:aspartate aminotransferase
MGTLRIDKRDYLSFLDFVGIGDGNLFRSTVLPRMTNRHASSRASRRKGSQKFNYKEQPLREVVSLRFRQITPSATVSLNNKLSELKEKGEDVISFAVGEPDSTTPEEIINFAAQKAREGKTHYTASSGISELRQKVALKYSSMTGKEISEKSVTVTPAKFALNMAVQAVIEQGDNVLIQDPSFVSYPEIIKIAGGKPRYFPSTDSGSPDIEEMKEMIDERTKMIVINSPSNPHGWVASSSDLKGLADVATDSNLFVLSDEIYEHIIYEGSHISILSMPGMEGRTFVVNGFSKSHAMTGWRIGYLISPSEFAGYIDSYQQHTITCAPSISQYAALKAIEETAFPENLRRTFQRRRDLLHSILAGSDGIEFRKPSGTFYAFPKLTNGMSGEEFSNGLLEQKKVLVTPGSGFGPSGKNRIRLSFALSDNDLEEGARRIVDFLK